MWQPRHRPKAHSFNLAYPSRGHCQVIHLVAFSNRIALMRKVIFANDSIYFERLSIVRCDTHGNMFLASDISLSTFPTFYFKRSMYNNY